MSKSVNVNAKEAGKYLGLNRNEVYALVRMGALPGAKQIDRKGHYAIPFEALEAFKNGKQTAGAEKPSEKKAKEPSQLKRGIEAGCMLLGRLLESKGVHVTITRDEWNALVDGYLAEEEGK